MSANRPTAAQFIAAAASEVRAATALLIEEAAIALPGLLELLEAVGKARSVKELLARARKALGWAVRRVDATDASELLLEVLRWVVAAPVA